MTYRSATRFEIIKHQFTQPTDRPLSCQGVLPIVSLLIALYGMTVGHTPAHPKAQLIKRGIMNKP